MTKYVRIAVEDIILKKDDWEQYCKSPYRNLVPSLALIKVENLRFYEIEECDENGDSFGSIWDGHDNKGY
tara:strand:- start:37 stop:246 length:210 start_codon:yes stop_codon:yes gene_type:complete